MGPEDGDDYRLQLRVLLSYQDVRLRSVFADILDFARESKVRVLQKWERTELAVGDECVVIYAHPDGHWDFCVSNDGQGKDVKLGWMPHAYLEQTEVDQD